MKTNYIEVFEAISAWTTFEISSSIHTLSGFTDLSKYANGFRNCSRTMTALALQR